MFFPPINRAIFTIAFAMCLGIALHFPGQARAAAADRQDIVVGQIASLTHPATKVLASEYRDGIELALLRANTAGGIKGKRIRLVVADDNYDPHRAEPLARQLAEVEGAVALIGCLGTPSLMQLVSSGFLKDRHMASFAPLTGARAGLSGQNVFPVRGTYEDEVQAMLVHAASLGRKRIAFIYWKAGVGPELSSEIEGFSKPLGLSLVANQGFDLNQDMPTQVASIGRAVDAIGNSTPDAVVLIAVGSSHAQAVRGLRGRYGTDLPIYSLGQVNIEALVRDVGPEMARNVSLTQVMPHLANNRLAITGEFVADRSRLRPAMASTYTSFEGYVAGRVLVEVMKRSKEMTADAISTAANSTGVMDVGGFRVAYAPDRRKTLQPIEITLIGREGKLVR